MPSTNVQQLPTGFPAQCPEQSICGVTLSKVSGEDLGVEDQSGRPPGIFGRDSVRRASGWDWFPAGSAGAKV